MSILPRTKVAYNRVIYPKSRNIVSLKKKFLLSFMSFGDAKIHELVTIERMKRLDPSKTPSPSYMPSTSASSLALKLAKMSGEPAPKANNVTPASDSESLNVFAIR